MMKYLDDQVRGEQQLNLKRRTHYLHRFLERFLE